MRGRGSRRFPTMQTLQADRRAFPLNGNLKRQRSETLLLESARSPRIAQGVAAADWDTINAALDADGFAIIAGLLEAEACGAIAQFYLEEERFRSRINMARHGFGR